MINYLATTRTSGLDTHPQVLKQWQHASVISYQQMYSLGEQAVTAMLVSDLTAHVIRNMPANHRILTDTLTLEHRPSESNPGQARLIARVFTAPDLNDTRMSQND